MVRGPFSSEKPPLSGIGLRSRDCHAHGRAQTLFTTSAAEVEILLDVNNTLTSVQQSSIFLPLKSVHASSSIAIKSDLFRRDNLPTENYL